MTTLQICAYQSSAGKLWFANCPALPELNAAAPTFAELGELIEEFVKETLSDLPDDRLEAVMAGSQKPAALSRRRVTAGYKLHQRKNPVARAGEQTTRWATA